MNPTSVLADPPLAIIHVPHASPFIPDDLRGQFVLTDGELQTEIIRMTDWYTDELFACAGSSVIPVLYPVSRLVVDPERFEDDEVEDMAGRGMGVIYVRTSDGRRLRNDPTAHERDRLLNRFYRPHHGRLEQIADACLAARDWCLVIDAHSFPAEPRDYEPNHDVPRPAICIGTDAYHTPDWLAAAAEQAAWRQGWDVKHDSPFAGSFVPGKHFRRNPNVWSVMIEVRRDLYMNEETGDKIEAFDSVRLGFHDVCQSLIECAREYAQYLKR